MSSPYTRILLAVDFSKGTDALISKALNIVHTMQADITLLHVIEKDLAAEHIYVDQEEYRKTVTAEARQHLDNLVSEKDIPTNQQLIIVGPTTETIINTAKEHKCDAILVGSHGRHGVQLILGSTANDVLHHAQCDVIVVRYAS